MDVLERMKKGIGKWLSIAALGFGLASPAVGKEAAMTAPAELQRQENETAQKSIDIMFNIKREEPKIQLPSLELKLDFEGSGTKHYHPPKYGFEYEEIIPRVNEEGMIIAAGNQERRNMKKRFMTAPFSDAFRNFPSYLLLNGVAANEYFESNDFINLEEHVKLFDDYNEKPFDYWDWSLKIPLNTFAAFVGTVFWHELGHARAAFYLGGKDIQIHVPDFSRGLFGSASYIPKKDMSALEENIITAAGVDATSTMGNYLYQSLKSGNIPEGMKPFVATTALFMSADRHRNLWSSAIRNFLRGPAGSFSDFNRMMLRSYNPRLLEGFYVDIEDTGYFDTETGHVKLFEKGHFYTTGDHGDFDEMPPVYVYADSEGNWRKRLDDPYGHMQLVAKPCKNAAGISGVCPVLEAKIAPSVQRKIDIAYGVALGASLLELGLRFDEIKYLVGTALGNNPKAPEGFGVLKAGFYPIQDGFFISIDGEW